MMRFSRNNRALLKICNRERGAQRCQPRPQNTHPSSCQHSQLRTAASILQAQPCGTSRQAPRLPTHGLGTHAGTGSPYPSGANHNLRCLCCRGRRNPLPSGCPPSHRAGQRPRPQRQPQAPAKSKPAQSAATRSGLHPASWAHPHRRGVPTPSVGWWEEQASPEGPGKLGLGLHPYSHPRPPQPLLQQQQRTGPLSQRALASGLGPDAWLPSAGAGAASSTLKAQVPWGFQKALWKSDASPGDTGEVPYP